MANDEKLAPDGLPLPVQQTPIPVNPDGSYWVDGELVTDVTAKLAAQPGMPTVKNSEGAVVPVLDLGMSAINSDWIPGKVTAAGTTNTKEEFESGAIERADN